MVLYSAYTDPDLFWGRITSNPSLDPGRDRFFSPPTLAIRKDLGLVVTSGSRDRPASRANAIAWFNAWQGRTDVPSEVKAATIDGGTHAADSSNSYRLGVVWLFGRQRELVPPRN